MQWGHLRVNETYAFNVVLAGETLFQKLDNEEYEVLCTS